MTTEETAKMTNIIPFDGRARSAIEAAQSRAIDDRRTLWLAELADKLTRHRFVKPSDRERLARNWHRIMLTLKKEYGLKNKRAIYEVLQREKSHDDPQKMSMNYEIPGNIAPDAANRRKIIQKGERWHRLALQAAKVSNKDRHFWLLELLRGTSLVSTPSESTMEINLPNPAKALLDQATAACSRIAKETRLETFFKIWDQGWVGFRTPDGTFIEEGINQHISKYAVSSAHDLDSPHTLFVSPGFYWCTADIEPTDFNLSNAVKPLPSVLFGATTRFGPAQGWAEYREEGSGNQSSEVRHPLQMSFIQEYRLTIGMSVETSAPAPCLEIRRRMELREPDGGAEVALILEPDVLTIDDIFHTLESQREYMTNDDGVIFWGKLTLELPEGRRWCQLCTFQKPEDYAELEKSFEAFENGDPFSKYFPESQAFESIWGQLTEKNLELLAKVWVAPRCKLVKRVATLSQAGRGTGVLEAALLQGNAEGCLFDQLMNDARKKADDFYRAYKNVLNEVETNHRAALDAFGNGPA